MEVRAIAKHIRISAQKVRLVVDQIRGQPVAAAMELLAYSKRKAAVPVRKVLESAIANAEHNNSADIDDLRVARAFVDEGRTLKRLRPRAKGRADRILKRSCHISVALSDGQSVTEGSQ